MNQTACSSSISARFAAAAQSYHDESNMQRTVAEKLAASTPAREEIDSILEIGCGTGFLTELLGRRFPGALIDAVDIARPMIDLARAHRGMRPNPLARGRRPAVLPRQGFSPDYQQFCPALDDAGI